MVLLSCGEPIGTLDEFKEMGIEIYPTKKHYENKSRKIVLKTFSEDRNLPVILSQTKKFLKNNKKF